MGNYHVNDGVCVPKELLEYKFEERLCIHLILNLFELDPELRKHWL